MLQGRTVAAATAVLCAFIGAATASAAVTSYIEELPWWKTAVFYQVYPLSFKDSDGDGIGDLKGITEKAAYLKDIGVTAIWISPIFKTPMADMGYDISDYRTIDPIYGTNEDLKELVKKLKELDIKLLLDLVPNHTSDEHEWFQLSAKKVEPYTDYYVWHDGKVDPETKKRSPPNNWTSEIYGLAWSWHEERQQYYLHHFLPKQPDLNFRNKDVIQEMDEVIRFWLKEGLDGFRVDAVPYLVEDEEFRDEPPLEGTSGNTRKEQDHRYTMNLPETFSLLSHWADVVYNASLSDGTPRAFFVEGYNDLSNTIKYYGKGHQNMMIPFNFLLLTNGSQSSRPTDLQGLITSWMDAMTAESKDHVPNWVIGNHENSRVADNFGPELVDAMNLLTGTLPGVKVVYYGEELGMRDTFVRWDQCVDNSGLLLGEDHYLEATRDPQRTPMQWDDTSSAGFTSNLTTWLPVNPNYWWLNAAAQRTADQSHLKVFQAMTQARKDPVMQRGDLQVHAPDKDTLLIVRMYIGKSFALLINMGSKVAEYTCEGLFAHYEIDTDLEVVVASINSALKPGQTFKKGGASLILRPKAACLFKTISS